MLTQRQIDLARHALGLTGGRRISYRNYFCAGKGHIDYPDWIAMVEAGYATRTDGSQARCGGDDIFHLTRVGARAALKHGERLDPEDFPNEADIAAERV